MTDPYRIRSAETWAQARDDYLSGMTAEAVCSRHDLGLSIFRRRAAKFGWRRVDQDDPPPADLDLSIYDDIDPDAQITMARLRFVQALSDGKSVEAFRWRRLWRELRDESDAILAELDAEMTHAEFDDMIDAEQAEEDEEDDALLLALSARPDDLAPEPAENVHDVHSTFFEGSVVDISTPLSRAERRRLLREARKAGPPQNLNASTTPVARPPDTTDPPAIA